jgi:hypothetical protein
MLAGKAVWSAGIFSIVDCQPAGCVYAARTGTAEEG